MAANRIIDLSSDTSTRPSPGMRKAMAEAEVGDEQKGEDPTTNALQARVAELLGKEAAVFLPSGTMCNQIAMLVHCRPGDEVIAADMAHIFTSEAGGGSALAGVQTWPLATKRGIFSGAEVEAAVREPGGRHGPRSRFVGIEQTVNRGGGSVWPLQAIEEVAGAAATSRPGRAYGWRAHPQCRGGERRRRAAHGGAVRQRLGRSVEGAGLPGRRRAGGLGGVHRRGLAVEASPGRRAAPIGHAGCGRASTRSTTTSSGWRRTMPMPVGWRTCSAILPAFAS